MPHMGDLAGALAEISNFPMGGVVDRLERPAPSKSQLAIFGQLRIDPFQGETPEDMEHLPFLRKQIPMEKTVDDIHSFPDVMRRLAVGRLGAALRPLSLSCSARPRRAAWT